LCSRLDRKESILALYNFYNDKLIFMLQKEFTMPLKDLLSKTIVHTDDKITLELYQIC